MGFLVRPVAFIVRSLLLHLCCSKMSLLFWGMYYPDWIIQSCQQAPSTYCYQKEHLFNHWVSRRWESKEKETFHFQTMGLGLQCVSLKSIFGHREAVEGGLLWLLALIAREGRTWGIGSLSDFVIFSIIRILVEIWKILPLGGNLLL